MNIAVAMGVKIEIRIVVYDKLLDLVARRKFNFGGEAAHTFVLCKQLNLVV